jgi:biopolymer transport protein ExbD
MRLSHRTKKRDTKLELQLTPMIDVVFQLLIFFLVTLAVVRTEKNLDSAIQAANPSTVRPSDLEPVVIEIVRPAPGAAWVFKVGSKHFKDLPELSALLAQLPNKIENAAFVRAPDDAPFDLAATAIQAAKGAGYISVHYAPKTP